MTLRLLLACAGFLAALPATPPPCDLWPREGERTVPIAIEAPAVERSAAEEALQRWLDEIRSPNSALANSKGAREERTLIDLWAALDPEKGMLLRNELLPNARFNYQDFELASYLASSDGWEEIVKLQAPRPDTPASPHLERLELWAEVARLGLERGDLALIERARRQLRLIEIEMLTQSMSENESKQISSLSYSWSQTAFAQFLAATAKLELLRRDFEPDGENAGPVHGKIRETIAETQRYAAGSQYFGVIAWPFSTLVRESASDYATLDSWGWDAFEFREVDGKSVAYVGMHPLSDWGQETLLPILNRRITWHGRRLPDFENEIVVPWIYRQIETSRPDAVLSYLAMAQGDEASRARLLAMLARSYPLDSDERAVCRRETEAYVGGLDDTWTGAEGLAAAELALLRIESGDLEEGEALIGRTLEHWPTTAFEGSENYYVRATLVDGMIRLPQAPENLPAEVREAWTEALRPRQRSNGTTGAAEPIVYSYSASGIQRTVDVSRIADPWQEGIHPSHAGYYAFLDAGDWPAAVAELERLAQGNSAWKSNYSTIGARSAREIGLTETFKWTVGIEDPVARFRLEAGAIEAVLPPPKDVLRSYRDASTPKAIAPGTNWPRNPFGC